MDRTSMIAFRNGINVNNLMDFYNSPDFNNGSPIYDPDALLVGGKGLKNAGVIILGVPQKVTDHLTATGWQGNPLKEIGLATDAMITLAGIDNSGYLTEDQFRTAAKRKTIGRRVDSYEGLIQEYLQFFPNLLMTTPYAGSVDRKLSSFRPDKVILANYKVMGVVPAPLMENGSPVRLGVSVNLPHQVSLMLRDINLESASPEAVEKLYSEFIY